MALVAGAVVADGANQEEGEPPATIEDPRVGFKMPYNVATIKEFELRAYWESPQTEGDQPEVEWLWSRIHAWCGIQTPPGRMMGQNAKSMAQDLGSCRVPESEWKYRGQEVKDSDKKPWNVHTVGSRCLMVVLIWMMKNKSLKHSMKKKALNLLLGLVKLILEFSMGEPFMGMIVGPTGQVHHAEIHFEENTGLCRDAWGTLLSHSQGAVETWQRLSKTIWLGHCITTPVTAASAQDIILFLSWVFCHPTFMARGQNLFMSCALQTLPNAVNQCGAWLSRMAVHLGMNDDGYHALPTLKTKSGMARRGADPVNRLILLWRLRKMRINRRHIATSHEDLSLASTRLMLFESYLDCMLHSQALMSNFGGQKKQVSISWDPSSYGGKEVLVSVLYHPGSGKAAWLMNQELGQVMVSEIDESLWKLAKAHKLTRVEGYKELRGLSSALRGVGLSLKDFEPPKGLVCRPLTAQEYRIPSENGTSYDIFDESTGLCRPEVPAELCLGDVPILLSISDQGPNNTAALNFVQYSSKALMVAVQYDAFHRSWNDLKLAFKRTSFSAWKIILRLTMLANIPYGPYGSSQWWFKKKAWVEEYLTTNGVDSPSWQAYQHLVCTERRMPEPQAREDAEKLFASIGTMPSIQEKGPLIKLMRWFSWFESMSFLEGQFWITKLIMSHISGEDPAAGESPDDGEPTEHQDPQKELQALKKRKGVLKLAPTFITKEYITAKDCILSVGKATWKAHASRAREVTSPLHMVEFNIACASNKFWAAELEDMIESSLWDTRHLQHVLPQYNILPEALEWQTELLDKVLESRTKSLVSFYELPPNSYHHSLSSNAAVAKAARDKAVHEFQTLLEIESAANQGADIKALADLYWRFSPVTRTVLMAYEQDRLLKREGAGSSQALKLQEVLAKNLGDSRIIEVGHQGAKDILRSSKSSTFSNTSIMSKLLSTTSLQARKVDTVSVAKSTKVEASVKGATGSNQAVSNLMKSKTHQLPKDIQELMAPKTKKASNWPSPSPASLFQGAASTRWLLDFWNGGQNMPADCNEAWKSALAIPGAAMGQASTGLLVKVIAAAEYSFLGWIFSIQEVSGEPHMVLKPNRTNLIWLHMHDLQDWVVVPTKPALLNSIHGPIGWKRDGDAISVELAMCLAGLPINVKHMRWLIAELGGKAPSATTSRKDVENALKEMVVPEYRKAEVNANLKARAEPSDEEIDSEFSEVLSELGHEEGNLNDIKDLKAKRKKARMKRKGAPDTDQPVNPPKKKKKGKGKGKGQDKSKSEGKAKRKKGLGEQFINHALKRLKATQGEGGAKPSAAEAVPEKATAQAFDQEDQQGGSASSSSKPPPPGAPTPAPDSSDPTPAPEAGSATAKKTGETRASAPKQYKSPEEVLAQITPPGAYIGLSSLEHRWTSRFASHDKRVGGTEYAKQSHSASFALMRGWREALQMVHSHNWNKFLLLNPAAPNAQTPGEIPDHIYEALEPTVKNLPPVKRYTKD